MNSSDESDENSFLNKKRNRDDNSHNEDIKTPKGSTPKESSKQLINTFNFQAPTEDLLTLNNNSFKNGIENEIKEIIKTEIVEKEADEEEEEPQNEALDVTASKKILEKDFDPNVLNSPFSRDLNYSKVNESNQMRSCPLIPFFDEKQKSNKTIVIEKDQKVKVNNYSNNLKFVFGNEIKIKNLDLEGKFSFRVSISNVKAPFLMGLGIRDLISTKNSSPFCPTNRGYFVVSTDFQMYNSNNIFEDGMISEPYKKFENTVKQNLENLFIYFEYCYNSNNLKFSVYKSNKHLFSDTLTEVFSTNAKNASTGLCPIFIFPRGGGTISVDCI